MEIGGVSWSTDRALEVKGRICCRKCCLDRVTQARHTSRQGPWSSPEGRIPGRIEAKLLSNSVSVLITQPRPYLAPGRGVGCWSDDFEAAVDCSVFEYADVLG